MSGNIKIIECPRDAMQGITKFIPTDKKIQYINQLLKVGFDTIDFGSFVSPKAIPQLRDTAKVLSALDLDDTSTNLLAIVANVRGAIQACAYEEIGYLGFPLSVAEQFQKRNTNKSISEAIIDIEKIQNLLAIGNKKMVVYLSMAFGNPYGEKYHPDIIAELVFRLNNIGVEIVALSDTTGVSRVKDIAYLFNLLINEYSNLEFGAHFHTKIDKWQEKIAAAYQNGCIRFDSALRGYGGCPMAADDLVGNMPTEKIVDFFSDEIELETSHLHKALELSYSVFN